MKNARYEKICNLHKAEENRGKNAILAFLSGGVIGLLGEGMIEVLCFYFSFSRNDASSIMIVSFIFFACLFTGLGFFDRWVHIFRSGLLIPITGFAHSMMSSSLDYKGEGPIYGIGSNMFKLAGSVIVYGIVSAWLFGLIRFIIGGIG